MTEDMNTVGLDGNVSRAEDCATRGYDALLPPPVYHLHPTTTNATAAGDYTLRVSATTRLPTFSAQAAQRRSAVGADACGFAGGTTCASNALRAPFCWSPQFSPRYVGITFLCGLGCWLFLVWWVALHHASLRTRGWEG